MPAFLAEARPALEAALPGVIVYAFGHLGDGNIHFNLIQPQGMDAEAFLALTGALNRKVHDLVARHGGSISAEHGLGRLRREEIARYKSGIEIELMRRSGPPSTLRGSEPGQAPAGKALKYQPSIGRCPTWTRKAAWAMLRQTQPVSHG